MQTFEINGSMGKSMILIGGSLKNLAAYLPGSKRVIITDHRVRRLYGDHFPNGKVIEIGEGETIKTIDTVRHIFEQLIALEADRNAFIVGIGGGIVCDISGFVASTYLRGVRFGFVPTTLLAQVDASVGGKNGVNFSGYKNIVGVFNQPEFVLCDLSVLRSLSDQDRGCGLAEVVKHAVIACSSLFSYLKKNVHPILSLSREAVLRMVNDSVVIKSAIVNRDEKETGERRKLNFGHTFGHAIEKISGLPHGEAVSIGMMAAARFSAEMGYLPYHDVSRLQALLTALKLPTQILLEKSKLLDALRRDKKRKEDVIHFVFLKKIGEAFVEPVYFRQLESAADQIF